MWIRGKKLLGRINLQEVATFRQGMDLLMNTDDGSYVVDDELFSSRSQNVEAKCVLQ